ncbi:diacylglycerol glucosyltransferase [Gemella sp. ND 6198]|uniref:MGDG synthase family glycosyltransferase n=1 Tax=Gemella sp. ND 6198 TaxID=2040624 RepID=UPI000E0B6B78|nr:glycosyltransferase [Gemella sp. ND 6198]AXI26824.1 diacylglycerol glucosyltransferase [Gemella sp. ND 6198]
MKKRILLITGSFGNGHLQVSGNLKEMFEKKYKDRVIVDECDLFLQAHPRLTSVLRKLYLYSFSYFRNVYGYLYYMGKNNKQTSAYRYFSYHYLYSKIEKFKPDIIVSTFPTTALTLLKNKKIPIVNVVTDYHFHKSWLTENALKYFVPCENTKIQFIEAGVKEKNIKVLGLPISEKFDIRISKKQWLAKNNLDIKKETLLLVAGAFGVLKNFNKIVDAILARNKNIQLAIVCGKNVKLKNLLKRLYKENYHVKILGYTTNMREWMQASTVIVTKAGGVTITESLASNIPLVLLKPVPGQEKENALYFEKNNMAKIADTNRELVDIISKLLENKQQLIEIKKNMAQNYLPNATEKICEDIVKIIKV